MSTHQSLAAAVVDAESRGIDNRTDAEASTRASRAARARQASGVTCTTMRRPQAAQ